MAREIDTIFLGSDNTNELLLKVDGVPQDLSSVTKIDLEFDDGKKVSNSTSSAFPIKWTGTGETGKVILQLGDQAITEGERTASLLTFDPVAQDGIVWSGPNGIRFFVTQAT
jgi:hypothetical protein